jgi:hypothetical protein
VWLRRDRIVEVTDDGVQIAHLVDPVEGQPATVITVDGTSIPLTRHTRHRLEAGALTISEAEGGYVLSTTSPVPLEAALLYWHLMLGDYVRPLPIA